jgi:hypothetical protein
MRYPLGMRKVVGGLMGAAFVAALVWTTLQQSQARSEVCMVHRGREVCEAASAVDRDQALAQARNSACARLSSGVTDGIRCNGTAPRSVRCSE